VGLGNVFLYVDWTDVKMRSVDVMMRVKGGKGGKGECFILGLQN
jgi:hypothetical protein